MGIKKLYQRKGNVASALQISAATNLAKKKNQLLLVLIARDMILKKVLLWQ